MGVSKSRRGFWVGWSCFASVEPPMIILGEGTRQIVAWSRDPRKGTLAPFLRTTQQGSCDQWYQDLPMAKSPLSQITWATIWRVPSPKMIMGGSAEPRLDHPTQKPLLLFETPIRNHLKAGVALYEPFCGSGTALIAAERTGTRCYAMEIDPIYVEVALRRWERFSGEIAVRVESA